MTSKEIRDKFLKFFEQKGHKILPSSSLVPQDDPSVLLTTAGMQQFKKWFTGIEEPKYPRVATIQKCVRTTDIEEVGDDTHLTFFEMLGNFSFNYPQMKDSYFKKETIEYAWEFLTDKKWLGIDKKRIGATYFDKSKVTEGPAILFETDNESKKILQNLDGLKKIEPQGEDNFWTLGTVGSPGGPTVEFYIDGIETWNLVFNEAIWTGNVWKWSELKSVDTGMGLERLLAVLNGKKSVYETDLFTSISDKILTLAGILHQEGEIPGGDIKKYVLILSDHLKSATFLLGDGITPSNIDQGYILRRLIRRAVRYGKLLRINQKLGIDKVFTQEIAQIVIDTYKKAYFQLERYRKEIIQGLKAEEENFYQTLEKGMVYLEQKLKNIRRDDTPERIKKITKGDKRLENPISYSYSFDDLVKIAFDVYQAHGFPIEMTIDILSEDYGICFSQKDILKFKTLFQQEFEKHQELSRKGAEKKFKGGLATGGEQETKYHTATHLLQQALRDVLGSHIEQRGSNITSERLRFDFSHPEKMTDKEIKKVEEIVNNKIKESLPVTYEEMTPEEAKIKGAIGLFEAKYGEKVKVYRIGNYSVEICGGPHVKNTSELGNFKIIKEESSSAGIRRIKAVLISDK